MDEVTYLMLLQTIKPFIEKTIQIVVPEMGLTYVILRSASSCVSCI
jgi:hypothetical protein